MPLGPRIVGCRLAAGATGYEHRAGPVEVAALDGWSGNGPLGAPLAEDEVHVWRVRLEPESVARLLDLLTPAERERAAGFPSAGARDRFVGGRGAARLLLGALCRVDPAKLQFARLCARCGSREHGKPYLTSAGAGLEFNVSHSGELVLVAVARGVAVGVDVERRRDWPDPDPLARRILSPAESDSMRGLPLGARREALLTAWTRKEAYGKGRGTGVSGLTGIDVDPLAPGPVVPRVAGDGEGSTGWRVHDLDPGPGYAAAVAARGDVVVRRWTLDPHLEPAAQRP